MGLAPGFRATKIKKMYRGGITVTPDNHLVINLPDLRILNVITRSVLLALAIISTPWLGTLVIGDPFFSYNIAASEARINGEPSLPVLLRDLTNEGLLKSDDKALFLSYRGEVDNGQILNSHQEMDLISESDAKRQSSIPDGTFDFVFAFGFGAGEFIDRSLKTGGIVAIQMSNDASKAFHKPSNYKIVFLRQYESTVLAMRKTNPAQTKSPMKRRLFGLSSEAKKAALNGLEDVLLEPPRVSSVKQSKKYLKRTKYLPDLIGDSLEEYPRRVFIDVGLPDNDDNGTPRWFEQNYPTRNRDFEMYKVETVNEGVSGESGESVPQMSMSDWLMKNVREEEYVVMKAEAEIVEEMVKNRAINLVDELFLECKHQGLGGRKNKSRRAYWECLALYGRLRDEGVAVHQWWG
ncbi:uncharacterized protein LOC122078638 [Macadamia integrifolia]|uniref:uncharacterized protein LOC122078638 n=1 Tax=Macadamia integrifolia TaxID=60698 RepID=UPI001C4E7F66|nr:uncharacterized protein LOC122078638 [Macadamia integrifolia]